MSLDRTRGMNWWVVGAILFIVCAFYVSTPRITTNTIPAPVNRASAYAFGDTRSIGQTFNPLPGLHMIRFPISTNGTPTGPLILHIRSTYLGEDIRTSTAFQPKGEEVIFTFDSIQIHEPLVWVLEAPNDPDRSYLVYREIDEEAQPGVSAFIKAVEIKGNFGFTQEGKVSVLEDIVHGVRYQQGWYRTRSVEAWAFALALVVVVSIWLLPRHWFGHRFNVFALIGICIVSFVAHLLYADYLPFINDEGAYIQDAIQSTSNFWPLRDFLTKGPLYIGILKLWLELVPIEPVAIRALSAISWIGGCLCLYFLIKAITQRPGLALGAAACMAISPAAIAATTPLLLQVVSTSIGLAALLLVVQGSLSKSSAIQTTFLGLSGVLMVAAYLTRASSIVYALLGLFLVLYVIRDGRVRAITWYCSSGILTTALIALLSGYFIGWTQTAVLFNTEAFFIAGDARPALQIEEDTMIRQWVEGGRLVWRGAPWLVSGFLVSVVLLVQSRWRWLRTGLAFLGLVVLLSIMRAWQDMGFHIPSPTILTVSLAAILAFGPVLWLLAHQLFGARLGRGTSTERILLWLGIGWIGGLAFIYSNWFQFIDNYIVEFIPPLAILTVGSGAWMWRMYSAHHRHWIVASSIFLVVASAITGGSVLIRYPHSGTIALPSLRSGSKTLAEIVPPGEPIFTAQSSLTAFAQRPIMFGYSHSGWYLYEHRGLVAPQLRRLFFQEPAAVTEYLRHTARFVLMDDRTKEVYFNNYPEREAILAQQFELITSIDNPTSQSLDVYARLTAE